MLIAADDPRLRQICRRLPGKPRAAATRLRDLASLMIGELCRHDDGVALSAPQIGYPERAFIVCIDDLRLCCGNPRLLPASCPGMWSVEGCLSLPDTYVAIRRPSLVHLEAVCPEGKVRHFALRGLHAAIVAHEMDHLRGVLITDEGRRFPSYEAAYAWVDQQPPPPSFAA